jgi:hypothetical protein
MSTYLENFSVSDSFLSKVKESIGYPLVDNDTLAELFTDDWIRENICAREAETFFNFFPLVVNVPINVSGTAEVSVDAPLNCLGVVHSAFVESGGGNNNLMSGNPFYTSSIVSVSSSIARNYGTPFDYNSYYYSSSQQNFFNKALQNSNKSFYAYFDEIHEKIVAKSTLVGTVSVDCGCYAESVDMIPKRLRTKYLELCQSALAIRFARTLQMQNSDLPLSIDVDSILDENKEIHENLVEWMQQNSTYCIMR